jgi:Protein of unknown function (DUF2950)
MDRWRRRLVIAALILLALFVVGVCVVYPQWRMRVMMRNERSAGLHLRILCSTEADFRANDRDGNGINDFWTGDVSELSRLGLLPKEVGMADAHPITPLAPKPVPFRGYFFEALATDDSVSPSESYRQDTDQKSGKVHHLRKFAFVAYPATPGVTGRFVFIISDNNNLFYNHDWTRKPSGWPTDDELRSYWPHACDY